MSTLFSFSKPIPGGSVGTPMKVIVRNMTLPTQKEVKEDVSRDLEENYLAVSSSSVSTSPVDEKNSLVENRISPLVGLNMKTGKRFRIGKPKMKINGKFIVDKDKVFSVTGTEPMIGKHLSDEAIFKMTRIKRFDGFLTSSTSIDTTGSLSFTLGDLPGTSDVASLFDVYRIVAIEVWIIPRFSNNTDRAYNPGLLATVTDYDGGSATYDEVAQYPNAMISSGLEGHYRSWAPAVIINTTGPLASVVQTSPWLDCAITNVAHHGLNYAINPTSLVQTYDRVDRYHLEFKRVR